MSQYIVKALKTYLKTPLTTSAGSVVLRKLQDSKGNNLTLANFGGWGVIVIKQGDTIEMIKFDGLSTDVSTDVATLTVATLGRNLDPTTPYAGYATGSAFQSGAEVIVTNDPLTVMQFGNINNAQTWASLQTFSLAPKSSVDATASDELVRKSQLDSAVLGVLTNAPVVIPATAGETVLVDELVYLKTADGLWYKTDADVPATVDNVLLGIARGGGTVGVAISNGVTILGEHVASSAIFVADTLYYASNTAGAFASSAGTTEVVIGHAKTTTKIIFAPKYNTTLTAVQKTQIEQLVAGTDFYGASVVGTDAYAITPSPAITAYTAGMRFRFKTDVANTGASTLAVSGLSAIAIKTLHDHDTITGDIEAGQIVDVVYDGTNFQMQGQTAQVIATNVKFGGTGADGALAISSGTTNIDLGGVEVFIKNYTTIDITGTGALTFSNPHANGTEVILKATGDVNLTSSAAPMISVDGMGGGTPFADFYYPTNGGVGGTNGGGTGSAGANGKGAGITTLHTTGIGGKIIPIIAGGAGGAGGSGVGGAGGAGGRGGGALIIECGGAWNFTTAGGISSKGLVGAAGVNAGSGGGGGGAGGTVYVLYNSLTANTGTITLTGGAGGAGEVEANTNVGGGGGGGSSMTTVGGTGTNATSSVTGGAGGTGATGFSLVIANTEFA